MSWRHATFLVTIALTIAGLSRAAEKPPARPSVSVIGDVKRPGMYEISPSAPTLLRAVDAAGGASAGNDQAVILFRKITDKLKQEIRFNSLTALREHPQADVPLQASDLVVIKKHPFKDE